MMNRYPLKATIMAASLLLSEILLLTGAASAQQQFTITPRAEKTVADVPAGPLFWRIETFPTLAEAEEAAGQTGLAVEAAGKAWLFTLGPTGASPAGGESVAEVGPIEPIAAPEYLLRINEASGPPGATTPVHTHPGSEAFYVLAGQQSIRSPDGVLHIGAGSSAAGRGADVPMQVSSSGAEDLHALVMFVVDATRPFSSPAEFQ